MVFDATTLADVKLILKTVSGDTSIDSQISDLITAVSARAEEYIGRSFEIAERTETFDVGKRTRSVFLRHWPIDTGQTFTVKNNSLRDFTGATLNTNLYAVDATTGRLFFTSYLIAGPGVLQVTYTGGIAANAAALQAIPSLEYAIRRQVAHEYNRRNSPGIKEPVNSRGGKGLPGEGQLNWLEATRAVLDSYRSTWVASGVGLH